MRWAGQGLGADPGLVLDLGGGVEPDATGGTAIPGLVRTVRTPDFAGVTFHEVLAKSVLNQVPRGSPMPFAWTVNPYRGCTHACRYCFARNTHTYLDLDAGADFDSQIVVKVNAAEVLTRELARGRNRREHVALGTNTDPYQRAEGRYRLMPGILRALAKSGSPVSVLTKGTLLARDLPLLASIAREVPVGLGVSIALVDGDLQQHLEPGTPTPAARLELVRRATDLGLSVGVMVAPVLPYLTDSDDALDATLGAVATAGATGATVLALHLRPGAREWYLRWLAGYRPDLLAAYEALYPRGAYARTEYTAGLAARVGPLRRRHGLGGAMRRDTVLGESWPVGSLPPAAADTSTATAVLDGGEQLSLDLGVAWETVAPPPARCDDVAQRQRRAGELHVQLRHPVTPRPGALAVVPRPLGAEGHRPHPRPGRGEGKAVDHPASHGAAEAVDDIGTGFGPASLGETSVGPALAWPLPVQAGRVERIESSAPGGRTVTMR